MPDSRAYLQHMGIDIWVERGITALDPAASPNDQPVPVAGPTTEPAPGSSVPGSSLREPSSPGSSSQTQVGEFDWAALRAAVSVCTNCELSRSRTQTVFGTGSEQADWLIVGEAPGAEEDRQGEPFVGRAGQLLNSMLLALGFGRQQVFIANILKCRPPDNRDPKAEEVAACQPYLHRQIALLKPKLILAVGRVAAQNLLGESRPIGKMRGSRYQLDVVGLAQPVPVIVTYHPAYLLRSPHEKRKVWQDLTLAMATYQELT